MIDALKKINMKMKFMLVVPVLFALSSFSQGLLVNPNTLVQVQSGTHLYIANGNLVLNSDANGDATLLDYGQLDYESGHAKVERYLTQGKWHLISSPIAGAVSGMFTNDYLQYHTESSNLYTEIEATDHPLNIMQGYALWTVDGAPSTEVFSGSTNTGSQSISISKTGDGWNLIGNPYPSAIDWGAVTIPSSLNGAIWVFDPTQGSNGAFREYIEGGGAGNTTTQYIASGQGFFVRGVSAGSLSINNNARVFNGQDFYKNVEETQSSNPILVIKAIGNGYTTQTAVRFDTESSNQIDRLFDVEKILSTSPDLPETYTICENKNMAINTLPSVEGNETIPLYFTVGMDGTYRLKATELESLMSFANITLEDVSAGYFQDLKSQPEYEFNYSSGEPKQFNLHFKDITSIDELESAEISCYLNRNILYVNFSQEWVSQIEKGARIAVYSISGQHILSYDTKSLSNHIPFQYSEAVYLVQISTNEGMYAQKVMNQ